MNPSLQLWEEIFLGDRFTSCLVSLLMVSIMCGNCAYAKKNPKHDRVAVITEPHMAIHAFEADLLYVLGFGRDSAATEQ